MPKGRHEVDAARILEAFGLLQAWARERGLLATETEHVVRTPQRQPQRFSASGGPAIEGACRSHRALREPSKKKRERPADKASQAPELVVQPTKDDQNAIAAVGHR